MNKVWAHIADVAIAIAFLIATLAGADLRIVLTVYFVLKLIGEIFKLMTAVLSPIVEIITPEKWRGEVRW